MHDQRPMPLPDAPSAAQTTADPASGHLKLDEARSRPRRAAVASRSLAAATLAVLGAALGVVACGSDDAAREAIETDSTTPDTSGPSRAPQAPDLEAPPGDSEPPLVGTFPRGFLFGTAIAGFQVDMGCPTLPAAACEDRASDWYQWITTPRIVDNPILFMSKDPPNTGPGFFELYEDDLDGAQRDLGSGAVRLSIEWSRIFPRPTFGVSSHATLKGMASKDGIAYYHRLFAAMKKRGLVPFVTVNHYSLPLWIHDGNLCNQSLPSCIAAGKAGWADPNRARIVGEIAKFAGFLGEEFGGEVDHWASLNEPFSAVVVPGYILASTMRTNPPGLSGPWMNLDGARTAASAMVEAHARIYDALKANDTKDADGDGTKAEVGIVYAFSNVTPKTTAPEDVKAADDARYFFHDMFMDGAVFGRLDEQWNAGRGKAPVRADLANRCDFIGVNFYFGFRAKSTWLSGPMSLVSPYLSFDMLEPFDDSSPQALYGVLMDVAARYKKPLYVTETGTKQDEDEARGAAWIVRTLAATKHAINDGVDVRGYFAWSLMDNYEWNHGMHMRLGLYGVDPTTKARTLRAAGKELGVMSKARDVPGELITKYISYYP